jgi:hypothetical protein
VARHGRVSRALLAAAAAALCMVSATAADAGAATRSTDSTVRTPPTSAATTVADWRMDEAAGSTQMLDSSGNSITGLISSGVRVGQPGQSGLGYGFAGNGALVSVPNNPLLNPGTGPFSVSLSFKSSIFPTPTVGDYDLIRKGLSTTAGGDWKIEVEHSGRPFCHLQGASRSIGLTGKTNVVDGAWHRLECRTTTSGTALVVDGTVQAQTSRLPGNSSNTAPLTIGAKSNSQDTTTGVLDEVVITKG